MSATSLLSVDEKVGQPSFYVLSITHTHLRGWGQLQQVQQLMELTGNHDVNQCTAVLEAADYNLEVSLGLQSLITYGFAFNSMRCCSWQRKSFLKTKLPMHKQPFA
jgi:hypothetical protein